MAGKQLPNSCIECHKADCTGYCKILNDRQEDYALRRHKHCPLELKENGFADAAEFLEKKLD